MKGTNLLRVRHGSESGVSVSGFVSTLHRTFDEDFFFFFFFGSGTFVLSPCVIEFIKV